MRCALPILLREPYSIATDEILIEQIQVVRCYQQLGAPLAVQQKSLQEEEQQLLKQALLYLVSRNERFPFQHGV